MPYTPSRTAAAVAEVDALRLASGLSWSKIAEHLDRPLVWTVSALLGSQPVPPEDAASLGILLGLSDETVATLQRTPYRVADDAAASDPTIYRFHELLAVYGPAIKEIIHEEFGDGIMSAINCNVELQRREDPSGDRVVVTIDGKFLAYQW